MRRLGTGVFLGHYEPGTPEWIDARRRRVGGSEVAAVLGLSPWESPFSLWHRKRGTIAEVGDADLMWWGRETEPVIAKRFALMHPEFDVRRIGTYVNPDRPYQLISPDRALFSRGATGEWELLEIKTAVLEDEWGEQGSEDVPLHYRCQLMWAMDLFGRRSHRLAVYFGGGRYREYRVAYDEHDAEILRKRVAEFVASLERGDAPPIDGHAATFAAVREMHPELDDVDIEAPGDIAEPFLAALAAFKAAEQEKSRAGAELAAFMETSRRATYGVNGKGKARTIATRVSVGGRTPYLRAAPLPQLNKEIA